MANRRIGLVGANPDSGWARRGHVPAIAAVPNISLTAVATRRRESADRAADVFHATHAFVGAADLAASPDVDLVVIAVKAPDHEAAVMAAFDAGKPVICEWPLGATLEQGERMAETARARGLRGLVGLQGRFSPVASYARHLIDEGFVGRVQSAQLWVVLPQWGSNVVAAYAADEASGVNVLTIAGGHCLDMLTFLAGDVASVSGEVSYLHREGFAQDIQATVLITAPDQFAAHGRLRSGAVFSAHIVGGAPNSHSFLLRIIGSEGELQLESPGMPVITPLSLKGGRRGNDLAPLAPPESFLGDWSDLSDASMSYAYYYAKLASEPAMLPDFDEAVKIHRLLDTIRRSSELGQRLSL